MLEALAFGRATPFGFAQGKLFSAGDSSADSGLARKIVIYGAVGRRLVSKHANHADNLATVHRGMFKHMPQNFPARETPLNSARKL
jgi:hypothetical protein